MCFVLSSFSSAGESRSVQILCTTFPIYQLTRNIVEGSATASVDLMLPADMGCPHDYALTPQDMAKIAAADVLAINGAGMEEFLGRPLQQANPDVIVIDSANGVEGLLEDGGHRHHEDEADDHHDEDGHNEHAHGEEEHHHHDNGVNPHLFASPRLSARLVENIAGRLCTIDPAGASVYAANAADYAAKLRVLAEEMAEAGGHFANPRVVEPHGAFDYLARDVGLKIVAHLQPHGRELSASQMLEVLRVIREKDPAVIIVEPQYPARVAETLAAETDLPVVRLDPMASGPDDAPLDYYEKVMRTNLTTLRDALGK